LVRSGRLGKLKVVNVDVGAPSKPCDLPEEKEEPGLDWDRWLGRRRNALQLGPQSARRSRPFPQLAQTTANTPAA